MSLRRLRNLLNIASTGSLAIVRGEVEEVSGRVAGLAEAIDAINARNADARAQQRSEADALRGETESLRAEIHTFRNESAALREALATLSARFDTHAERSYASADDLYALRAQIEGDEKQAEKLRLKLAAIAEQLRWESEDLRKGLAAIVERVERERKAS